VLWMMLLIAMVRLPPVTTDAMVRLPPDTTDVLVRLQPDPPDRDRGKQIYMRVGCYQCHGREAQGASGTGPRLGPRPIAFAAFSRYIRQPTGQMPPYTSKVVSDQELADMYAFLQSLPQPPAAKSIPLLNN